MDPFACEFFDLQFEGRGQDAVIRIDHRYRTGAARVVEQSSVGEGTVRFFRDACGVARVKAVGAEIVVEGFIPFAERADAVLLLKGLDNPSQDFGAEVA